MIKKNIPVRLLLYIFGIAFTVWMYSLLTSSTESEPEKDKNYQKEFESDYSIYAINIPSNLNFSGEKVPVENFDIYESIDREFLVNTYWQSQTLLFIKRANKYFPIIEPILEENGIPDDFKYLAVAESGLQNVVSPAGATGVWQFMKGTAKEYGLEVNSEVDERYNLKKSTEAACKYLNDSYKKYSSWTLVAASYNMGMGGLDRQLSRQKVNDYYDLLLNSETGRYVFRILAIKTILSNPAQYGFHLRDKDLYQNVPVFEVKVDTTISDLVEFAKNYDINYKVFKVFNPWLRQIYLNNTSGKLYTMEIPKKGHRNFNLTLEFNIDTLSTDSVSK